MKDEPGSGDSPPKYVVKKEESPAKDTIKKDDSPVSDEPINLTILPGNQNTTPSSSNQNAVLANPNTFGASVAVVPIIPIAPMAPIAPMTSGVDHNSVAPSAATPTPLRSLQSIADDPTRTHRTWYPKYGRVQKCDYCNKRSEGTLHVCSDCHVRICEHCARARKWDRDTSRHFIDVDACDWIVRKTVNLSNQGTSNAPEKTRARKAKRRAPSSPGDGASSTASQRRKIQKRESTEDKDDTRPMAALRPAPLRPRRGEDLHSAPQFSTSSHNHNENLGPNHQASAPGNNAPPARMETSTPRPGWINVNLPPPRTRPVSRQTAARALLGMSEFSRYNDNDEEGEDDDDDGYDGRDNGRVVDGNHRLGHHGNLMAEDRGAEGFARARAAHPLGGPRVSSAFAAPAPPSNWERDVLIQDIYEWVYGVRPNPNPSRFRSRIPDTWGGDWPFPSPVHGQSRHGESQSRGRTQPPHQGQSSYPHSMRSDVSHSSLESPRIPSHTPSHTPSHIPTHIPARLLPIP